MVEIKDIYKIYEESKTSNLKALNGVTLKVDEKEFLSIIGKSGAGKSTLLHIIGGLDVPTSGEYLFNGEDVSKYSNAALAEFRNKNIGIVMQDFALINDYTVFENVKLPLELGKKRIKDKKERVLKALKEVGIEELAEKGINKLSGGQKQRVAIARAIVNEPKLLLADEPTGALDVKTSMEIMELFSNLNKNGTTVIIITHDLEVARMCSRSIEISDGKIIE